MKYFLKKILQAVITLLLVSMIVFVAVRASGDPTVSLLPADATKEERETLAKQLGLDQPLPAQYLSFMKSTLSGDLGTSYSSKRPVITMIREKLPYTLTLAISSVLIALVLTVLLGSISALKRYSLADRIIMDAAAFFQATPLFFAAILAVEYLGVKLKVLPVSGYGTLSNMILPVGLLSLSIAADMTVLLRNNMVAVLESDFIKYSRLKGLAEYKTILKHALRNSVSSVLALSSFIFAHLISGSIIIESIFAWPGIGTLSYTAVIKRDFPLVQGIVLILAVFMILLSFLMDFVTALVDPRLRKED